jgi:hypothetical protein
MHDSTFNLSEAKAKRYQFSNTRAQLVEEISEFEKQAGQYFKEFHPMHGYKGVSQNPFESVIHKTWRQIGLFDSYNNYATRLIDMVEEIKLKKKR